METTAFEKKINKVLLYSIATISGLLFSLLVSCDKHDIPPEKAKLSINLNHLFDGSSLLFNPVFLTNEAGNNLNVTDLKYYLSGFKLLKDDGSVFIDKTIFYIDAENLATCKLLIDSIPPGKYKNISFSLGIDPIRNVTGGLPNSMQNINMAWPDPMGGGYHFMKFEGQFEMASSLYGYAFHLGKNQARIDYSIDINKSLKFWDEKLDLKHNVAEWFKNPLTYDLTIHEAYSMNSDSVIQVIKENGKDVFSL